jgi:hypothetical protein
MRAALLLLAACACTDPGLAPGEVGLARAFGEVRGAAPLDLFPPVLDRAGNVYVLYGPRDLPEVQVFVGNPDGGWKAGCRETEGGGGVHGWVGQAANRAWYWAGGALVEVSGETGACRSVLDRDPTTGAELSFLAVLPRVDESPSRTSLTAIVTGPDPRKPFLGVVDLDTRAWLAIAPLEIPEIAGQAVAGVGADGRQGVVLFAGGTAVWLDAAGQVARTQVVAGAGPLRGPLAIGDDGTAAGALETGGVLAFGAWGDVGGQVTGLSAVGVHRVRGALYAVGVTDGRPHAARLRGEGRFDAPRPWGVSEALGGALRGRLEVLDDRAETRHWLDWETPAPAIGEWPLVSAHAPHLDDGGHGGWLVAGPAYLVSGQPRTLVAYVPVGVGYS